MKLQDLDFRIWHKEKGYLDDPAYIFYQFCVEKDFDECLRHRFFDEVKIELWSGSKDKNDKKIFEGDIVAHCNGNDIEYHSKVVFNPQKFCFEFVCIEHPAVCTFDKLSNSDLKIIGNIHKKNKNTQMLPKFHKETKRDKMKL